MPNICWFHFLQCDVVVFSVVHRYHVGYIEYVLVLDCDRAKTRHLKIWDVMMAIYIGYATDIVQAKPWTIRYYLGLQTTINFIIN